MRTPPNTLFAVSTDVLEAGLTFESIEGASIMRSVSLQIDVVVADVITTPLHQDRLPKTLCASP